MNFNKYTSGAGLDKIALKEIKRLLDNVENNINILEFGSGISTQFLVDYKFYSKKNILIDTFDNDPKYAYKNSNKHDFVNLYIKPLLSCTEEHFDKMFDEKKIINEHFFPHKHKPGSNFWRQRNCFYDMKNIKLKDYYDFIIVDGPNGNGRNLSYLFFKDKVKKGTIIFIDDYDSRDNDFDYKFIPYLKSVINVKEIKKFNGHGGFNKGGNFAIFEVL